MIASPTQPEFAYELADSGDLSIQFTNSKGRSSACCFSDPELMRWVGERCLESGRGGRDVTTHTAVRSAATGEAAPLRKMRRASSAHAVSVDPAVTVGPAGTGELCIRFALRDGTFSDLLLGDPQSMRDVALVFLRGAEICAELRSDGLAGDGCGVLYSSEYDTDEEEEDEDEDL